MTFDSITENQQDQTESLRDQLIEFICLSPVYSDSVNCRFRENESKQD